MSATGFAPQRSTPARTRVSAALFRRPWLRGGLLLSGPLAWFVLIYLAALVVLFVADELRGTHARTSRHQCTP